VSLTLTVLGCSGSFAAPDRPCSGYLVRSDTTAVVIDLGPGTFAELQRHIAVTDLDAIVLSHAHPDHWVDLTGLRVMTHYELGIDHVPVWGTEENREMVAALCTDIEPALDWHRLAAGVPFTIGDLTFLTARTEHYVETHAVLVTGPDGERLVYSSDTGPGWSMEPLAHGADLALVESSYATAEQLGDVLHLAAGHAGALAASAEVKRLVLTHLVPGGDADEHVAIASKAFPGPVVAAIPGAVFTV
jgi:ribonuclease BN (tRNA processing enzyme)